MLLSSDEIFDNTQGSVEVNYQARITSGGRRMKTLTGCDPPCWRHAAGDKVKMHEETVAFSSSQPLLDGQF